MRACAYAGCCVAGLYYDEKKWGGHGPSDPPIPTPMEFMKESYSVDTLLYRSTHREVIPSWSTGRVSGRHSAHG